MYLKPYTKQALIEAKSLKLSKDIFENRLVVAGYTIDGPTSKDLDDGITLSKSGNNYLLQVSIADVAASVKTDSALFSSALERVETMYLGDSNKPMLPKILSESRLSLLPGRLKPALTFEMEILPNGTVNNFAIKETAFKNIRRLNYSDFDAIKTVLKNDPDHIKFNDMSDLAELLLEQRRSNGALALYDIHKGIYTNEEGIILPLKKEQRHISNIVIQEFMILTNKSLARFCAEKDIPILYRNHTVRMNAPSRSIILEQLNTAIMNPKFLDSLRQRSSLWFNRATYDPVLKGHYGLNEVAYTHVTSPIRRVADLINHYLIKAYIHNTKPSFDFEKLSSLSIDINKVIMAIKDEKAKQFMEEAIFQSKVVLNYSTKEELVKMKAPDFRNILSTAAKNDILIENLEEALDEKFKSKKIDLNMIFILLFYTSKNSTAWHDIKEIALKFLYANSGFAVQLLNILVQKEIIETFETDYQKSEAGFLAKISVKIKGKFVFPSEYSQAARKKDAAHESAHSVLQIILDMPFVAECETQSLKPGTKNKIQENEKAEHIDYKEIDDNYDSNDEPDDNNLNEDTISHGEQQNIRKIEYEPDIESLSELKEHFSDGKQELLLDSGLQNQFDSPVILQKDNLENDTKNINRIATEENYIGKLLELFNKNKDWKEPEFQFSISGLSHSPLVQCFGKLVTPGLTVEAIAESNNKKAAKQEVAKKIVTKLFKQGMANEPQATQQQTIETDNFVGRLQECCIKLKLAQPDYNYKQIGFQHEPVFECTLTIKRDGKIIGFSGNGLTKKIAKQNAAEKCFNVLMGLLKKPD